MTKNTKKKPSSNKTRSKNTNRFSLKNLSLKVKLIGVFVIAIFGMLAVAGTFAQSKRNDYTLKLPTEQTSISLTDEKPLIVSKDSAGKITYESRGKSINVTVSGTVYCTPENDGPVKVVSITPQQMADTANQIESTQPTIDTTKQSDTKMAVGNTKQLQLPKDSSIAPVKTDMSNPAPSIAKTEKVLDKLCAEATTTVPDSQVPVFIPDNAPQPKKKRSYLDNKISESFAPKVYAADVPQPITAPPVLDEGTEVDQVNRINLARQQNGVQMLGRSECLTKAARIWTLNMATVDTLYHSPIVAPIEKECGPNWWHRLGENVGYGPSEGYASYTTFQAYMNSPGHRANILNPEYQRVGVGAYTYRAPGKPWTLLWTSQLFASCMGSCVDK